MIEAGAGKFKSLSPLSSPTEPSREWNLYPSSCGSTKPKAKTLTHSILEFNAFNARLKAGKRARKTSGTQGMEFVAVQKFGKDPTSFGTLPG